MKAASLKLSDGRRLPYRVQVSPRSRSLRLKLTAREGLVVVTPRGMNARRIKSIVRRKESWITRHLARFDEVRHLLTAELIATRPQVLELPALGESWCIEYQATRAITTGARVDRPGRILIFGRVDDATACQAALRRWLSRRARAALVPQLESLSKAFRLRYAKVLIKGQRTRWRSCSASQTISLNYKLLFLSRELVRYVLLHELCHTTEMNHTQRFWTLLRKVEPQTETLHSEIGDAWKRLPAWIASRPLKRCEL